MKTRIRTANTRGIAITALLMFAPFQTDAAEPDTTIRVGELIGFASVAGTTTGGGNATPTKVTTFAELEAAARDHAPQVIIVSGTIKTEGGTGMRIGSNKTILGADKNATIHGGLLINSVSNVILRNFNMKGIWPDSGPDDAIAVRDSHHVWIDHLNIWDGGDGNLDITRESSHVTVSWCKFWYTDSRHPHRFCPDRLWRR